MMKYLKEATISLQEAKTAESIDQVVFLTCKELVREITLFLPLAEAISTINYSMIILEKS
jgi:hypothetical protein